MSYRLHVPAEPQGRPVVEGFIQQVAEVGGLHPDEAALLSLACGDLHAYLSQGPEETELEWHCLGFPAYAEAQVWLPARPRTWQALQACQLSGLLRNFTREKLLPAAGLKPGQTSLMHTARSVEQVSLGAQDRRVGLRLRKEHSYPEFKAPVPEPPPQQPCLRLVRPDLAALQDYCLRLPVDQVDYPIWMGHPARLMDLLGSHEVEGVLALGKQDRCLGGMFWKLGHRLAEGFGPYLVGQQSPEVAEQLLDYCLQHIARTSALGLLVTYDTPQLPVDQFEKLGHLKFRRAQVEGELPIYFRMLHEDPGGVVWAPEGLQDWLRQRYSDLALAREVRAVSAGVDHSSPYSAFSTDVFGERARLHLRPIHGGQDFEENLKRYVQAALDAGLPNIFLSMDLGQPWQAALGPQLQRQHFAPRYVRPLGGESLDLLIWQHELPSA